MGVNGQMQFDVPNISNVKRLLSVNSRYLLLTPVKSHQLPNTQKNEKTDYGCCSYYNDG